MQEKFPSQPITPIEATIGLHQQHEAAGRLHIADKAVLQAAGSIATSGVELASGIIVPARFENPNSSEGINAETGAEAPSMPPNPRVIHSENPQIQAKQATHKETVVQEPTGVELSPAWGELTDTQKERAKKLAASMAEVPILKERGVTTSDFLVVGGKQTGTDFAVIYASSKRIDLGQLPDPQKPNDKKLHDSARSWASIDPGNPNPEFMFEIDGEALDIRTGQTEANMVALRRQAPEMQPIKYYKAYDENGNGLGPVVREVVRNERLWLTGDTHRVSKDGGVPMAILGRLDYMGREAVNPVHVQMIDDPEFDSRGINFRPAVMLDAEPGQNVEAPVLDVEALPPANTPEKKFDYLMGELGEIISKSVAEQTQTMIQSVGERAEGVDFWDQLKKQGARFASMGVIEILAATTEVWQGKGAKDGDVIDQVFSAVALDARGSTSAKATADGPDKAGFNVGSALEKLADGDQLEDPLMLAKASAAIGLLAAHGTSKLYRWGNAGQLQQALKLMELYAEKVPGFNPTNAGFNEVQANASRILVALKADEKSKPAQPAYQRADAERGRLFDASEAALDQLNQTAAHMIMRDPSNNFDVPSAETDNES